MTRAIRTIFTREKSERTLERERRQGKKAQVTPKGIAFTEAIETGLIPKLEPYDAYDGSKFLDFWESFTEGLAKHYGFDDPEDVWKVWEVIANYRAKDRTEEQE